jgi:two-component system, NarL family, sensor histidine kinase BarA
MSYRAFKRLLGETSLERKCRFLFGAGILLLITGSFWLYAYLTESLAYKETERNCRLLVEEIRIKRHLEWEAKKAAKAPLPDFGIQEQYQYHWLRDNQPNLEPYDREVLKKFANAEEPDDNVPPRIRPGEKLLYFYGAVRAKESCIACHYHRQAKPNDLLGTVRIRMSTEAIVDAVHVNRAVLMATALGTALLIMAGSWIIVRYVIVKPVKHLKEVSDAISAGELNVRSEIQTGDEFEDLSHAFNRMLRNLVSMQDQYRKVNSDLDRKVDELAQANMALYESNRLKSDFLATMSHELRTPLNSILGFSEVLLSSDQLDDKKLRWVRNIQSSGEKLLNLINDILDLAKIEAGKMQVRLENFSIHDICEGLLNMFRPMAEKKNIDLRGQLDPAIPVLRQDITKLQQILQNLLSNAIKFTPEGGRVMLKAFAEGSHIILVVSDTGVGIAAEEQSLVFEKFRQSGNPLTREHAGTGLGLSIVRELAKLLGGEVSLQSDLGRGSTFTVHLPMQLSAEPRLEFDLADERIDLSKAQRVDVRLYAGVTPAGRSDRQEPQTEIIEKTE